MMKNKSKSFFASIISTAVFALYICALTYIIVAAWVGFQKSGLDDTRKAVEGSLYLVLMVVIICAFVLSLICLIHTIKNRNLFVGQARKIMLSTVFFDYFVAFLFFILSVSGVGVLAAVLYVVGLLLLALAGTLYLIDYNEDIKLQKANRSKIDNTAVQDAYYKIKEIMDKENEEKHEDKKD